MLCKEKIENLIDLIANNENEKQNSTNLSSDALAESELKSFRNIIDELHLLNVTIYETLKEFGVPSLEPELNRWEYSKHIYFVLFSLIKNEETHSENEVIAPKQQQKFSLALRKAIDYGLPTQWRENSQQKYIFNVLILKTIIGTNIFKLSVLRREKILILGDYLCALVSLVTLGNEGVTARFQPMLIETTNEMNHSQLFEILFLLKGRGELPIEIQKQLHIQLMKCLYRPGCFLAMCDALLPENSEIDDEEQIRKSRWHSCNVISKIIGRKGYSKEFYPVVINEIISHITDFIQNADKEKQKSFFIDAAVECLNKLFSLELNFIRKHIYKRIVENFDRLLSPPDLVTGSIVLDERETVNAVKLLHIVMCTAGPSHTTLPSEMIIYYLPLLVRLHGEFDENRNIELRNETNAVIVKCLSNRENDELNKIIDEILFEEYSENSKTINSRVKFCFGETTSPSFKVFPENDSNFETDFSSMYQTANDLVNVLKCSNHNFLIYKVFIHVLQLQADTDLSANESEFSSSELLSDSDELSIAIRNKFKRKLSTIFLLSELIQFKAFHTQFNENPQDICDVVNKILMKYSEKLQNHIERSEDNLFLILTLTENLLQTIRNENYVNQMKQTLVRLQKLLPNNSNLFNKVNQVLNPEKVQIDSVYLKAKKILCEESSEPYIKVHGIMTILNLVEKRHEDALLNRYEILALIMKTLRSDDSYVFLNCIKLLTALMYVMEQEVLDALIAEYHYDFEADTADIDFKLKIGETIVKVVSGLGEISFKYKDALISCFLRGCYHKKDEFRTSNISNLGNVLRILSYQIQSNFQEIAMIVEQTIKYDNYLPARRAAAFLITELLNGSDSLEELQEFLTPIYRQLKDVLENESDLQMQIHARNGLLTLREKVFALFKGPEKIEKEIKILGVKPQDEIRFK